jgi:hypothetical protein
MPITDGRFAPEGVGRELDRARLLRRKIHPLLQSFRVGLPSCLEDQSCDRIGLRYHRKVARPHLHGPGAHALGHEPFEIGIDRPVFGRNGIETRLRAPSRMRRLAREQRLLERLLNGTEDFRLCFGQVARKITQERGLVEASLCVPKT